jgi:hypothetical protein
VAALAAGGCGGADEKAAPKPEPASVALTKTYGFQGRSRRVDSRVTVSPTGARIRDSALVVPRGRRPFRLAIRIEDHGPSPFPFQWARFTLVSRTGARSSGSSLTPLRRLEPGRQRSARGAIVTFLVPKGFVPVQARMTSIVAVWPFEARWPVKTATGP